MNDVTRLRKQAQAARDQTGTLSDPDAAGPWLRIAEEYDRLAAKTAAMQSAPSSAQHQPKQQTAKKKDNDD